MDGCDSMAENEDVVKVSEEELSNLIGKIVHQEIEKHMPAQQTQGTPGMRLGKFQIQEITPDKEQVYCPTCGTMEYRDKPVMTKEVVKKVVEAPDNYIPIPTKFEDFKSLIDMPHPQGKSIWDCPNCSPKFQEMLAEHGFVPKQVKK